MQGKTTHHYCHHIFYLIIKVKARSNALVYCLSAREASKLHTKKHGPHRVINHIGAVYTLENLVTGKLRDCHVKLLSQRSHDELNSDVNKVAKIDEEFSETTHILSHRLKGSKKIFANLESLLAWEDDPKPRWFPWNSSFRSVEIIQRRFEENRHINNHLSA